MSGAISQLKNLSSRSHEFAVLIDPENETNSALLKSKCELMNQAKLPYCLVGGSSTLDVQSEAVSATIKQYFHGKIIGFPGSAAQLNPYWDGVLFLSLISSQNPDYLFHHQLEGTRQMESKGLNPLIFPCGYLLVGDHQSNTANQTQSAPIPENSDEVMLRAQTARNLGMTHIYIEAGSGSKKPVSPAVVKSLHQKLDTTLIIGGGIKDPNTAAAIWTAGADVIIVGNAIEKDPKLILAFGKSRDTLVKNNAV